MPAVERNHPQLKQFNIEQSPVCEGCGQFFVTRLMVLQMFGTIDLQLCSRCARRIGGELISHAAIVDFQHNVAQAELVNEIEAIDVQL